MPGLTGFTPPYRPTDPATLLRELQRSIAHRPFHFRADLFTDDAIAATRVDNGALETAKQPVACGPVRVWMDGEIFSGSENGALQLARHFAAHDANHDGLLAFDGIFAACVYDSERNRVRLVSDRYGFRHVYYLEHDGALWWSAELKTFRLVPGFEPRILTSSVDHFFAHGHIGGDDTWFEGVRVLPAGSVLTWDIGARSLQIEKYWRYSDIAPVPTDTADVRIVDELGQRFVAAVEKRSQPGRVGLLLSGGLDSRAILAAIPRSVDPLHAVTFGQRDAGDVRLAARAARVRGAVHHIEEIGEGDWLTPRFAGVWWTDGQISLMDMHSIAQFDKRREWLDVNLSGFLGDVTMGGSYIAKFPLPETEMIDTRGRRFITMGLKSQSPYFETRLPFFDNDLLEYALGLPLRLRVNGRAYHRMLLRVFPGYFRGIPWQDTGVPISWPDAAAAVAQRGARAVDRGARALERLTGMRVGTRRHFVDYASWLRQEPARAIAGPLLTDPVRRSAAFVKPGSAEELWRRHLAGENHAVLLARHLTLEVWLRQFFDGTMTE